MKPAVDYSNHGMEYLDCTIPGSIRELPDHFSKLSATNRRLLAALKDVELDLALAVGLPAYDLEPALQRVRETLGEGDWTL